MTTEVSKAKEGEQSVKTKDFDFKERIIQMNLKLGTRLCCY